MTKGLSGQSLSVSPDLLQANPWNTNIVSPENEQKLAASIGKLGLFKPIVVREIDEGAEIYEILGGEHRWRAARAAGLKSVPIFNLGKIDDVLAKKITLADNARYGADDTIELARLLEELGDIAEIQSILPFTDSDINAITSSVDIALDELDLVADDDDANEAPEPPAAKMPKTHTVMRFKIGLADAERVTELIAKTIKRHGFTTSDELTNAGDALVHLLLASEEPSDE